MATEKEEALAQISRIQKRPDFALISQIVADLKFFKVFDHAIRMKLLFISDHKLFGAGEIVSDQKVLDQTIIVVLSGLLQVVLTDDHEENKDIVRSSLYPGDSIGENSMEPYFLKPGQRIYVRSFS